MQIHSYVVVPTTRSIDHLVAHLFPYPGLTTHAYSPCSLLQSYRRRHAGFKHPRMEVLLSVWTRKRTHLQKTKDKTAIVLFNCFTNKVSKTLTVFISLSLLFLVFYYSPYISNFSILYLRPFFSRFLSHTSYRTLPLVPRCRVQHFLHPSPKIITSSPWSHQETPRHERPPHGMPMMMHFSCILKISKN